MYKCIFRFKDIFVSLCMYIYVCVSFCLTKLENSFFWHFFVFYFQVKHLQTLYNFKAAYPTWLANNKKYEKILFSYWKTNKTLKNKLNNKNSHKNFKHENCLITFFFLFSWQKENICNSFVRQSINLKWNYKCMNLWKKIFNEIFLFNI